MNNKATFARRAGLAITTASVIGGMTACGGDDKSDASGDGAKATATTAVGSTAEFRNLRDNKAITTKEYVAAITGTDIYAAFAISHQSSDKAITGGQAYFCDGKTIATWFRAQPGSKPDAVTFKAANGSTFVAKVGADGTISATVNLGGKDYSVLVKEVDADGKAGLYLADHVIDPDLATDERGGWIVLPDGTQRGAIRGTSTILPGTNLLDGSSNVVVTGRNILLRAITHIIDLDQNS